MSGESEWGDHVTINKVDDLYLCISHSNITYNAYKQSEEENGGEEHKTGEGMGNKGILVKAVVAVTVIFVCVDGMGKRKEGESIST